MCGTARAAGKRAEVTCGDLLVVMDNQLVHMQGSSSCASFMLCVGFCVILVLLLFLGLVFFAILTEPRPVTSGCFWQSDTSIPW